ncbi:MAG: hypothetical protein IMZ46_03235 [Acidobacteria bacterium]|nr:hypothetical protein [Acidobacteriota bacterium]
MADLLWYMDEVTRLHRADDSVYNLECWDATPSYFRFNDRLEAIRDIYGDLAVDVPRGEPILLTADPGFKEEDFQRVECCTVQIATDEVWWTAYVKHTNVRIETARVSKKVLLEIWNRFPKEEGGPPARRSVPSHPAVRQIHDLLYLDMRGSRTFYDSDKVWNADTLTHIAEVVARYIPRPRKHDSEEGVP